MAYADANTTGRKLGTGAIVLLIEGGLATALVLGLAASGSGFKDKVFTAINLPQPKNDPPPPPPVDKTVKQDKSVIDRPDTQIKIPPQPGTTVNTGELTTSTGSEGNDSLGEVVFPRDPDPVPSPEPLFKPKSASPKGQWKNWVTTNDYPTQELRMEHEGVTRYRLSIDSKGQVTECAVTASSGFSGLDKATCDTVKRRAKFEPATDQTGARTTGSFSGSVSWQIPKE